MSNGCESCRGYNFQRWFKPKGLGEDMPTNFVWMCLGNHSLRVFVSSTMMHHRTTTLEVSCSYDNISSSHSNQWSQYIYIFLSWCWIFVLAAFHSLLLLKCHSAFYYYYYLLFNFAERIVSSERSVFQTKWRIGNCGKKV